MTTPTTPLIPSSADGRVVEVTSEPVELYKILKFEGMAESGGQAKAVIAEGHVTVNGAVELQKRKKIMSGDTIEFGGEKIVILVAKHSSDIPSAPQPTTPTAKP